MQKDVNSKRKIKNLYHEQKFPDFCRVPLGMVLVQHEITLVIVLQSAMYYIRFCSVLKGL
jgi:hypothetical protein